MKKLDNIIDQIKSVRLENFSIEVLEKMSEEIKNKQQSLYIDILGRPLKSKENIPLIQIFNKGTSKKKIITE